jgi:hypothetical protein
MEFWRALNKPKACKFGRKYLTFHSEAGLAFIWSLGDLPVEV